MFKILFFSSLGGLLFLTNFLRRLLASFALSWNTNDNLIYKFKSKYSGQTCVIVGNGPSLTKDDLDFISQKGIKSFGVNKIYLIYSDTVWRPDFYVCEDIPTIESAFEEINTKIDCPKFIINDERLLRNNNTIRFNRIASDFKEIDFFNNPIPYLFCGQTVTYICMQLAVFMGFKTIVLLGQDFTWEFQDDVVDAEGYAVVSEDNEHFHPEYYKPGEKQYRMTRKHYKYLIDAMSFAKAKCEKYGVRVFNGTRGGNLEVFPRIPLEKIQDV
ncbi:6-hydroxymethylpterin diphosphokinase MptE-like protein [Leptospira biflexa]|uniref:6-hydroxymethylpterin diphosphokinase MptE-like protein n=1 Tax=Leptospira biflexa TaxID=172 RepID=UPI0014384966|nr:6-hydroxymethylpterin diphosphokinase MptE-like protein [Leptospira biflexa]